MNEKRRPEGRRSETPAAAKPPILVAQSNGTVVLLRLSWAEQLIANGPGFPEYGTAEWFALADDDRRKVAACVAAAEKWRTQNRHAEVVDLSQSPAARQRRIAEANRPRPGDHLGGPVPWDGAEVADAR